MLYQQIVSTPKEFFPVRQFFASGLKLLSGPEDNKTWIKSKQSSFQIIDKFHTNSFLFQFQMKSLRFKTCCHILIHCTSNLILSISDFKNCISFWRRSIKISLKRIQRQQAWYTCTSIYLNYTTFIHSKLFSWFLV